MTMIKELLNKICCCHEWYRYSRVHVKDISFGEDLPCTYTQDTLICKKCGKIKKIKLS